MVTNDYEYSMNQNFVSDLEISKIYKRNPFIDM